MPPLRDHAAFRQLRAELLNGTLRPHCRDCHIRPMVPVERFREVIAAEPGAPLRARPLRHVRLEITTRCNLRCVYCPVSLPGYQGRDLPATDFDAVLAVLDEAPPDADVLVNGHGETTFHPEWLGFARRLRDAGRKLSIITNLGKVLSDAEAACLAGFASIQISLDTVDEALLPQIRRKVQLATILDNIARIRRAAATSGEAPAFALSVGIYDRSIEGLPRLCAFAVAHGISAVTFWPLVKYDDIPGALNVQPIESLAPAGVRRAVEQVEAAMRLLRTAGIQYQLAGDFLANWKQVLAAPPPGLAGDNVGASNLLESAP